MISLKLGQLTGSRWACLTGLLVASLGVSGFFLEPPLAPRSLAHGGDGQAQLIKSWQAGDVIVLVRHAERCDRSDAPCLNAKDGITVRAQSVAKELGQSFEALGMANVNVASSPMLRAEQTAESMFGTAPIKQEWLFNCRGSMLKQARQHKVVHHNLILVTHSECIEDLESAISNPQPATPDYASSLFIIDNGHESPSLLGYLNADQWSAVGSTR